MEFSRFVRAICKSWWLIALMTIACGGGALAYTKHQAPVYASHLQFYVGSPSIDGSSANSTNQFAEDRAISYASLVSSDRLAERIAGRPGLPSSAGAVSADISASAELNTVLIDVTVKDTSRKRALAIAGAVGDAFPGLVDELDNTQTGSGGATVKLTLVSGPSSSGVPVSPRTRIDVALGIALGLLLGLLIAAAREMLDNSIRSAEAMSELTGGPVLGVVGYERAISAHPLLIGEMSASPRAEAVRRIRTNLRFVGAAEQARTVVITSSVEGEGKSTISVSLALSIAESGSSVLLIEGDLRRPGVSRLMNIEGSLGLTNVLVGQTSVDDVLQPWGSSGLTVLPCGTLPPNPAELLGSRRMHELLAALSARFDVVLIDSPPLLPVTDPALLAAEVDGAIVVFRHGRTRRSQLAYALEQLDSAGARVIGTVLNMKPVTRVDRRGYGHYYGIEPSSSRWWQVHRRRRPGRPGLPDDAFGRAVTAEPLTLSTERVAEQAAEVDGPMAEPEPQVSAQREPDRAQVPSGARRRRNRTRRHPEGARPAADERWLLDEAIAEADTDVEADGGLDSVAPVEAVGAGDVVGVSDDAGNAGRNGAEVRQRRTSRDGGSRNNRSARHDPTARDARPARREGPDVEDAKDRDEPLLETGEPAHRA